MRLIASVGLYGVWGSRSRSRNFVRFCRNLELPKTPLQSPKRLQKASRIEACCFLGLGSGLFPTKMDFATAFHWLIHESHGLFLPGYHAPRGFHHEGHTTHRPYDVLTG